MDKAPHSTFTTGSLSASDGFSAWRDGISSVFNVELPSAGLTGDFFARFDVYQLGQMVITGLDSSSARYVRDKKTILRDGLDMILIQLFLEGGARFQSDGHTAIVEKGDIVIFDLARKVNNVNEKFRHITAVLPRSQLEAHVPNISRFHGHVLPNGEAWTEILRRHILSTYEFGPDLTADAGAGIEAATVALAATALNGRIGLVKADHSEGMNANVRCQVKYFIRENLGHPDLSPKFIADSLGISRSQLYRIMQPSGGIMGVICDLRLTGCIADLRNPLLAHRSISEIAFTRGFGNLATFNRQFRTRYDASPSDIRARASAAARLSEKFAADSELSGGQRSYEKWLRQMAT